MGLHRSFLAVFAFGLVAAPVMALAAARTAKPVLIQDKEYPEISYFSDSKATWYTYKTEDGCLYWSSNDSDMHDYLKGIVVSAKWEGDACTPGSYITGNGKLTENLNEGQLWSRHMSGTMEAGVFQGPMVYGTSVRPRDSSTIQMSGGCPVDGQMCRPKHRKQG